MKHLKRFNESNSTSNEVGDFIISKLDIAIKRFGSYSYHDKGASEVMNLLEIESILKVKSAVEISNILKYVLDNHNDATLLVDELLSSLDDRDDFDDILNSDERFMSY